MEQAGLHVQISASFYANVDGTMDAAKFTKMMKDVGLVSAQAMTTADTDIIFMKIKGCGKRERRIIFAQFVFKARPRAPRNDFRRCGQQGRL
jgi:hypothetical protein